MRHTFKKPAALSNLPRYRQVVLKLSEQTKPLGTLQKLAKRQNNRNSICFDEEHLFSGHEEMQSQVAAHLDAKRRTAEAPSSTAKQPTRASASQEVASSMSKQEKRSIISCNYIQRMLETNTHSRYHDELKAKRFSRPQTQQQTTFSYHPSILQSCNLPSRDPPRIQQAPLPLARVKVATTQGTTLRSQVMAKGNLFTRLDRRPQQVRVPDRASGVRVTSSQLEFPSRAPTRAHIDSEIQSSQVFRPSAADQSDDEVKQAEEEVFADDRITDSDNRSPPVIVSMLHLKPAKHKPVAGAPLRQSDSGQ